MKLKGVAGLMPLKGPAHHRRKSTAAWLITKGLLSKRAESNDGFTTGTYATKGATRGKLIGRDRGRASPVDSNRDVGSEIKLKVQSVQNLAALTSQA